MTNQTECKIEKVIQEKGKNCGLYENVMIIYSIVRLIKKYDYIK